ncbi:MAG TPA: hypothetical protein VN376_05400, partial [Longilinea sp.]|nr:hypothetical protein [Longilinea sp.]
GHVTVQQLLDHPAYQTVCRHAELFSSGIKPLDVERAVSGERSPFYGMDKFSDRKERILALLNTLRSNIDPWTTVIHNQLSALFPEADLDITVYPIIGYDMGIGLNGAACLNVNTPLYLAEPYEFLFYIIHEATHVIYERAHTIPRLADVMTPMQWRSYFNLWLQNEGYAVYTPLKLRQDLGFLSDHDYKVLSDPALVEEHRQAYLQVKQILDEGLTGDPARYLECCFGDKRLTYRMGCELIRRIESTYGRQAVRQAFTLDCDEFAHRYEYLLKL